MNADGYLRRSRYHICTRCRRPVESASTTATQRGWHAVMRCHGDVQETLLTQADFEDNPGRMYWFNEYRELDAIKIPTRLDIHLHIHIHEDDMQNTNANAPSPVTTDGPKVVDNVQQTFKPEKQPAPPAQPSTSTPNHSPNHKP